MSESGRIPATKLNNEETWAAVLPELRSLVTRGSFILGPEVERFEHEICTRFGFKWCVGTSSGTAALVVALRASGLQPGARVALPANTFFATFEAIVLAGLVPVVIDHDEDYLIDLGALEDCEVDAVVPVHLYGLPVDMPPLMRMAEERGWLVFEDCAQAHGATVASQSVGSFGQTGAFSAYPTKNLGAWGDAGFVVGSDGDGAIARSLIHHGQEQRNIHERIGGTDRLDSLQALVLTHKLDSLGAEIEARRRVADLYRDALSESAIELPREPEGRTHVYHQFVVRVPNRERVRDRLSDMGIETGVHYPAPVHLQPAARGRCEVPQRAPRAEAWADEILSLPMFPSLQEEQALRVADALRSALKG